MTEKRVDVGVGSIRILLLATCVVACGAPARSGIVPSGPRPIAAGECTAQEHCHGFELCLVPDIPTCGGAEVKPLGECPPDRPHRVSSGCGEVCSRDAPRSCTEGHRCADARAVCSVGASDADAHGCVAPACDAASCGGFCVLGRCFERPGRCEEPAPSAETARRGKSDTTRSTDSGDAEDVRASAPPPVRCAADQHAVETCVSGGMAPSEGAASVHCATHCAAVPPGGRCSETAPRRWHCDIYDP